MTFPVIVRHRSAKVRIYGKSPAFPYYRLAFTSAGKNKRETFATYSEAHRAAKKKAKEIHQGSLAVFFTPSQSRDALAATERLHELFRETGKKVSLLGAVSVFVEATRRLGDRPVPEAVDGFLSTVVIVQRKNISDAVEEFIESRKAKAESKDGKRSQLSPVYAANVAMWLREFAKTLSGLAVSDLAKQHLNTYIGAFNKLSAKSRNDRRAVVKMFLGWSVRRDYLMAHHRLLEADQMSPEKVDASEIDFYRPTELKSMLQSADDDGLRAVIALNGLAGLRVEEIMRLQWKDVWHVKGHIHVSAAIAKGRCRRLVEMCPALLEWLAPFRKAEGPVWSLSVDAYHEALIALRERLNIPARKNGLRHGYVTFHFGLYANENLTAALAGNSPAMIHLHYRGLATRNEAKKWFGVVPTTARPKQ